MRPRSWLRLGPVAIMVLAMACGDTGEPSTPAEVPTNLPGDTATTPVTPDPPGPASSPEGNVVTYAATSLGLRAFSANGRIHPHGAPTEYYFEFGLTTDYGARTARKPLPPRLSAYYRETFDVGPAGWQGATTELTYSPAGGMSGGHLKYSEPGTTDFNHLDGVGLLHITQYMYLGEYSSTVNSAALGGGLPDLRDARVRVGVRGNSWRSNGSELVFWAQANIVDPEQERYTNWAHTGFNLTDALYTGKWEQIEYRLYDDTSDWTYAGRNIEQSVANNHFIYYYVPLDDMLRRLDTDIFHVLTFVDERITEFPTGSIDYDNFELHYRNHSLAIASNGGKLASAPPGSDDPATLTDGWRNGAGHTWKSAPSPSAPQEIVYDFERPVTVDRVQLHQNPDWPAKDVEVLVSMDGVNWTTIITDTIPETAPEGPNFVYLLKTDLAASARKMKVRILSGYKTQYWGLGEIEAFGTGALQRTDDDWYRVTLDAAGLEPGRTYHYRLVAVTDGRTEKGGDLTFTTPADTTPEAFTGDVSRITATSAKVEGRMNSLGEYAQVYFEYGTDTTYGRTSAPQTKGPEITPRTIVANLDDLEPGKPVHYRLVAVGPAGKRVGKDLTFVPK